MLENARHLLHKAVPKKALENAFLRCIHLFNYYFLQILTSIISDLVVISALFPHWNRLQIFRPKKGRLLREAENDRSTDVWLLDGNNGPIASKNPRDFGPKVASQVMLMLQAPRKVMVGVREGHDGHDVTVSGRCVFVCFGCWEGKGDQKSGPANLKIWKETNLKMKIVFIVQGYQNLRNLKKWVSFFLFLIHPFSNLSNMLRLLRHWTHQKKWLLGPTSSCLRGTIWPQGWANKE